MVTLLFVIAVFIAFTFLYSSHHRGLLNNIVRRCGGSVLNTSPPRAVVSIGGCEVRVTPMGVAGTSVSSDAPNLPGGRLEIAGPGDANSVFDPHELDRRLVTGNEPFDRKFVIFSSNWPGYRERLTSEVRSIFLKWAGRHLKVSLTAQGDVVEFRISGALATVDEAIELAGDVASLTKQLQS